MEDSECAWTGVYSGNDRSRTIRARFVALAPHLDERSRRVFAAAEAKAAGYGGIAAVWRATGIAPSTIGRALRELADGSGPRPGQVRRPRRSRKPLVEAGRDARQTCRIRRPGGGRKLTEEKYPTILTALEQMLEDEVAGDPMTEQKWIRSSLRRLREKLRDEGYHVSHETLARLLKKMGFSLEGKQKEAG